MVTKRERLSRSWCRVKREIFLKQAEVISCDSFNCKEKEKQAVLNANHGDTVYDIISSCDSSPHPSLKRILSALGRKAFSKKERNAPKHPKSSSSLGRLPNPYAKQYLNKVLKRSQRPSTDSCTEQDAKWKAMSENQKASRQKSKDIANKLAALQQTYNLKPMEIVVAKLPEDHDGCLRFSNFVERTNISPNKRNKKLHGSPEKVHPGPLNKRAKVRLSLQNESIDYHSKSETKDSTLAGTNDAELLAQTSVHNSHYNHNREELGVDENGLINHRKGKELGDYRKEESELYNRNNKKSELHQKEKDSVFHSQKDNNVPDIQIKQVHKANDQHCEENGYIIREQEINVNRDEGEKNLSSDEKENRLDNHGKKCGEMIHSKIESSNQMQEEKEHINCTNDEAKFNLAFDCKENENNTLIEYEDYIDRRDENMVVTDRKEETEENQSKTDLLYLEHVQEPSVTIESNVINKENEDNYHIDHEKEEIRKHHLKSDTYNTGEEICISLKMEENKITGREKENNNDTVDKEEEEKYPTIDFTNNKKEKDGSIQTNNENELSNGMKVEKLSNETSCHAEESDFSSQRRKSKLDNNWKEEMRFNSNKKREIEFNNHKKIESQPHNHKKQHKLLKDVKVSVQRYMGGNVIEDKRNSLNIKVANKEISVISHTKLENLSLREKLEVPESQMKSIKEDTKDDHFQEFAESLPNNCTQAAISNKLNINEVQIVKKPNLEQTSKKHGCLANSEKGLSYEQRLMNSKRLRKEDIIIPAKPLIEYGKPQKSNERNRALMTTSKLKKRKKGLYKKCEQLNMSPSVTKNTTKDLSRPNCTQDEEKTPCKKVEGNLNKLKYQKQQFVKDISRHKDLNSDLNELQKTSCRERKSQVVQEKLISETTIRENFNFINSTNEDPCKDAYSKITTSPHSSSTNGTSNEMCNKKFSPKQNIHKLNNLSERLHCSPTSSSHVPSSFVTPNKDPTSGKEKLRQESAKVRESLFAVSTCTRKSLSGYKIPKKSRTETIETNSTENNKDMCKLSPLYKVRQLPQSETYPHNGYRADRNVRGWQYGSQVKNGESQSQEQRTKFKFGKQLQYPNSSRWQDDSASISRRDSFSVTQNKNAFAQSGKNIHCDRNCAPSDSTLLSTSTDSGHNVFKDSNCFKHFSQNVKNGDYGLS